LFDISKDIGETQNLVKDQPEKVKELSTTLTNFLKEVDAQLPVHKTSGKTVTFPDAINI